MKLADFYAEISIRTGKFEKKLVGVRGRLSKLEGSFSKLAKRAAIAFAAMAAAATFAFAKMLGESISFEKQLARVSTMLSDNVEPTMKRFKKEIREMAMTYGQATKTLTDGTFEILSASIGADKAMKVLEVGTRAATAGFTDTKTAIDAILTVMKSYKMEAGDAARISDQLFAITAKGRTELAKLSPVIGRLTATAFGMGVNFEEVGAMLATVTKGGLITEQAISSLIAVLATFQTSSEEQAEAAKDAGFELTQQWLAANGLRKALQLTAEAQDGTTSKIFTSIEAFKAASIMVKDLTSFMDNYKIQASGAFGETEKAFKKATSTMDFQIQRIKQGFLEIGKSITTNFMLKMKPLVDEINARMPQIVKSFEKVGQAIAEVVAPVLEDLIKRLQKLDAKDIQNFANTVGMSFISLTRVLINLIKTINLIPTGFKKIAESLRLVTMVRYNKEMTTLTKALVTANRLDKDSVKIIKDRIKELRAQINETLKWTNASGKSEEAINKIGESLETAEKAMEKWGKVFAGKKIKAPLVFEDLKEVIDKANAELIKKLDTTTEKRKDKNKEVAEDKMTLDEEVAENEKDLNDEVAENEKDLNDEVNENEKDLNDEVNERKKAQWFSLPEIWKRAMEATREEEEKIKLPGEKEQKAIGEAQAKADKLLSETQKGTEQVTNINQQLKDRITVNISEAQMS